MPKIIKVGENLTKLSPKQFWLFYETWCIFYRVGQKTGPVWAL